MHASPLRRGLICGLSFLAGMTSLAAMARDSQPIVIAHRGASGYLPEHTLEAYAFAYAQGADFVEQDLVMSKDGILVVCHDVHIDTMTDVGTRYPGRARADGRYYAVDFTWAELKGLEVRERFDEKTGEPVFPKRFPHNGGSFRLCTMEEAILLVQGLNRATGRNVGLYPELKSPAWHLKEGKDPGRALLQLLAKYGYEGADARVFVQCFEPAELKRLRGEFGSTLPFVQLTATEDDSGQGIDYARILTADGLKEVASYAQGIGPHLGQIVGGLGPDGKPQFTTVVRDAQAVGLVVHPYTFRTDALPRGVPSIDALLAVFIGGAKVDGVFIDQPDAAIQFLKRR